MAKFTLQDRSLVANIFASIEDTRVVSNDTWRPEAPPCLDGIHEIYLNFEATGLKWWDGDRPISCSLYAGDRSWYLPWAHSGSGNLCPETMLRWARTELRGKNIKNINTRFDIHIARVWGVDLEAQGNTVSDIGHYAALLDDHRLHMNLDSLISDYLREEPMPRLDESKMQTYSAGAAAPRSRYNVESVKRLNDIFWPMLDAEDLQTVRALEDKVIFVTCEMEKNGAPIDTDLLDRWIKETKIQLNALLLRIATTIGFQVNPRSPIDQERVFRKLGLPLSHTKGGRSSFTDTVLKQFDQPVIKDLRRAAQLMSLRAKYITNTKSSMGADGILRFALHQLRASKDENADIGEAGTVTGRFSSAKPIDGVGCNIQQRMKAAKQRVKFGYDEDDDSHDDEIFLVRKLHIPQKGMLLLSSDMDQAQYRIFASYVNNPRVIQAYKDDPSTSFHKFMHATLAPYADLTYRQQKDLNFAVIFGAGLTKMALMMGHITAEEFEDIRRTRKWDHPKLAVTKKVKRIYDREIPEVKGLLSLCSHLGKPRCDDRCRPGDLLHQKYEHRGFVTTMLGRRMRFPDGTRLHKAFNGVDQGTEADYMKTKLVELHEARHETQLLLRVTNHDEVVGDIPDQHHAQKVHEILNHQSFSQLRVPLTWSTGLGPNWADLIDLSDYHE